MSTKLSEILRKKTTTAIPSQKKSAAPRRRRRRRRRRCCCCCCCCCCWCGCRWCCGFFFEGAGNHDGDVPCRRWWRRRDADRWRRRRRCRSSFVFVFFLFSRFFFVWFWVPLRRRRRRRRRRRTLGPGERWTARTEQKEIKKKRENEMKIIFFLRQKIERPSTGAHCRPVGEKEKERKK